MAALQLQHRNDRLELFPFLLACRPETYARRVTAARADAPNGSK